jgi:trigger factor
VENGSVEAGQPFKYTATVEVRPRVEPKDYEGLAVPKIDAQVTDGQVDERIEELRTNQAMFVPVEGREVVEAGDYVSADYEGFVDGAPLRGAKREGVLLEAVPGSLLENKAEALLGAKVGETREVGVGFPSDYAVEELRGKEARFKVLVKSLKRREVPALDDAFVQDLGGEAKTVAELRAKLRWRRWWRRTPSRRRPRWWSATWTRCSRACWKGSCGAASTRGSSASTSTACAASFASVRSSK